MSDEDLIGYLFDLLDPIERATVAARVAAEPAVAARLARLRSDAAALLAVAEAEREEPPRPRPGLAVRTIARLAEHLVETEPREPTPEPAEPAVAAFVREYGDEPPEIDILFGPGTRAPQFGDDSVPAPVAAPPPADGPEYRGGGRFRADLFVAACIAFVGIGLVLSGVAKARNHERLVACQNSLRTLHSGLAGYADHDPGGFYPQVGPGQTADAFATALVEYGHLPAGYKPGCPAAQESPVYPYTLGFRGPDDKLLGLRKPTTTEPADENDLMPISADLPAAGAAPCAGPVSPHGRSMNVLFVGGNVRVTTSPHVGPHGDDIYRNVYGRVKAGANRADAVLGRTGDTP